MGEAIRKLRERQGLTLDQLAEQLGMSRAALGRREVGDTRVKASEYAKFARAFGITEEQLRAMAQAAAKGQDLHGDDGRLQTAEMLEVVLGQLGSVVVRIVASNSGKEARLKLERLIAYAEGLADIEGRETGPLINVVGEPIQRDGYVEQIHTAYEVARGSKEKREADGKGTGGKATGSF